jgi:uncharacterized membrane protein YvlD (DUF360 family)
MPDAIIGGPEPFMYHVTNILIHLIASCLVYKLLRTLTYAKDTSFFVSLIFVVHPALTQAVAWIPGRNDSLMTIFVLASFITFIQYVQSKKVLQYVFCLIFFTCALFTKETALVIPIIFFLYLFANGFMTKRIVMGVGSGFLVSGICWAILRHFALKNPIPMTTQDMIQSVVNNAPASIQLLGKSLFPSILPVYVQNYPVAIVVSIVIAFVNMFIRPIIKIVTLPINIITLGIFSLVVNGICVLLVPYIVNLFVPGGFVIHGLLWAIVYGALVSFTQSTLSVLVK